MFDTWKVIQINPRQSNLKGGKTEEMKDFNFQFEWSERGRIQSCVVSNNYPFMIEVKFDTPEASFEQRRKVFRVLARSQRKIRVTGGTEVVLSWKKIQPTEISYTIRHELQEQIIDLFCLSSLEIEGLFVMSFSSKGLGRGLVKITVSNVSPEPLEIRFETSQIQKNHRSKLIIIPPNRRRVVVMAAERMLYAYRRFIEE